MKNDSTTNEPLHPELHRLLIKCALLENVDPQMACNRARAMTPRRRKILLAGLIKLSRRLPECSFDSEHDQRGIHAMIERPSPAWRRAVHAE